VDKAIRETEFILDGIDKHWPTKVSAGGIRGGWTLANRVRTGLVSSAPAVPQQL
jgi:hypothetical protein